MNTGLILLATGLVALAVTVNLVVRSRRQPHSDQLWVTRDLRRGDLRALANLARGRHSEVLYGQITRLEDRRFVKKRFGAFRVTIKGYAALLFRMTVARNQSLPDEVI